MADLKAELEQLGNDLINRQVNLIIAKGGMSAEPMPEDPVVSMRDIYRWYYDSLLGRPGTDAEVAIDTLTADQLATSFSDLAGALVSKSREGARALAGLAPIVTSAVSERLVSRIQATSLDLAKIATHLAGGATITAREVAVLRKAWEIGTDEVVMQTTIGLDGDMVVRVDSRYGTDAQKALFDLHDQSVSVAMRTWKDVVGAAVDLLNGLFRSARS